MNADAQPPSIAQVTRLAPSPTGALHLGNARTFLINWAMARRLDWKIVLRIEDLDTPRVKSGADRNALQALQWLGIDWDIGPIYQRFDLSRYHSALTLLGEQGLIYPCRCTRAQIAAAAASAPHADDHELRYNGACRPAMAAPVTFDPAIDACWRLRVPDETIEFQDQFAGFQRMNTQQLVGDFIVATKAGMPSYQLAVVIDDAVREVTQVVRGDDLLTSAPRQMLLYRLLNLSPLPWYTHLPLVRGADGRRLAKRHGDTRVMHYHDRGASPERMIGLMAEWCGLGPRRPMTAAEFARDFSLGRLGRQGVVFTPEDDRWLLDGAGR